MKKKYIFLSVILLGIIISFIVIFYEQKIAVLGYHSFYKYESELQEDNPEFINDINKFERQMKYLKDHNYKTLTMDEFYCWKQGKCSMPRKSVLITIDDGNLSNYMYAFPILKKYGFNATVFFIISNSEIYGKEKGTIYDTMSLELIEKCKEEYPNIEFYPHSYGLHGKPVVQYTDEELINDIKSINKIGNYKYYAYPFGVYDDRIINLLKENGYIMAFGFGYNDGFRKARKSDNNYAIARLNISNYVSMNKFILRLKSPY